VQGLCQAVVDVLVVYLQHDLDHQFISANELPGCTNMLLLPERLLRALMSMAKGTMFKDENVAYFGIHALPLCMRYFGRAVKLEIDLHRHPLTCHCPDIETFADTCNASNFMFNSLTVAVICIVGNLPGY